MKTTTSAVKNYSHVATTAPDPHRFDGASEAAKKVSVARDPHFIPPGKNRERAWILWRKIQSGQIRNATSIAAIKRDNKEFFEEFESKTYSLDGTSPA